MEGTTTQALAPARPRGRVAWVAAGVVAVAGAAVAACQALLLTVCVVSGRSMEPTLADGQRVLVLRVLSGVQRGDLVVFKNPDAPEDLLVKRVVALPREEVRARTGQLLVGDYVVDEPYVLPGTSVGDLAASRVPDGCYYLLGDNRAESADSRAFGAVDRRLFVGKVVLSLGGGT